MNKPSTAGDLLLLVGRVVIGAVFIAHGLQKFLEWGIAGTAQSFGQMGIPVPGVSAWVAALVETVGGAALVLGAGLPVAGVLLALNMLGALVFYHLPTGFFVSDADGGIEYVLVLAAASLVLAFRGGAYTLDNALTRNKDAAAA
ncbi:DoxX family protein [Saccharopolyspora karakumensis]|uniref:DoxX family protein n=1 Tax=Saccharopolyspora karakumensis TaxID=2530386 RepID=A0A4R5BHM8_9PSEU|nr:DoxX family protein [Saccharopolyspora karakumensis]TDD86138.1 DoxX family protein [Saccharopolyspora karakumensis]